MEAVLKTNKELSSYQIADCLAIIGNLTGFLSRGQAQSLFSEDNSHVGTQLDGGVKSALETTIINACNRLDAMIADDRRWTLPATDGHEIYEQFAKAAVAKSVSEANFANMRASQMANQLAMFAAALASQQENPEPPKQPRRSRKK